MEHIIEQEFDGMTLRAYLLCQLRLSHRLLSRLKKDPAGLLLDGQRVTVRAVLRAGTILTLGLEDDGEAHTVQPAYGLPCPPVLYEDGDILAVNKPARMPTHPSHGHETDTLANAIAAYDARRGGAILPFRPVNRLDRDTSGLVLLARNQLSAGRLAEAMRAHHIQKTYLVLLEGDLPADEGTIDAPIRRTADSIITRQVCGPDEPGAKAALTHYAVLGRWAERDHRRTLVLAIPKTGRTHQLRVHFAHLGAPIVGDTLYGHSPAGLPLPDRQALHALSLTFPHPATGQALTLTAPWPEELSALVPPTLRDSVSLIQP